MWDVVKVVYYEYPDEPEGKELGKYLSEGWEPFAVTQEPELDSRGYHISTLDIIWLRKKDDNLQS